MRATAALRFMLGVGSGALIAAPSAALAQDDVYAPSTSTSTSTSTTTTTAAEPEYTSTMTRTSEQVEAAVPRTRMAKPGIQLGARVGYAGGAGSVYSGLGVWDASSGTIPLMVDLGWRVIPHLYIGAYGGFAPVLLKTNPQSCPGGFNCDAQNWRFGLQFDVHPLPRVSWDPYIGFGAGYEVIHTTVNGTTPVTLPTGPATALVDSSVTDRGWEFGNITLGADFRLDRAIGLGPFFTATLARYNVRETDRSVTVAGTPIPSPVADVTHANHAQFIVGVRGTFNPGP